MNIKQSNNSIYRNNLIKRITPSEKLLKELLDKNNIRYKFQKGFYRGSFHCIVDFYIPKPFRTCIEINGPYHDTEEQRKKDYWKDKYLTEERKLKVIRIKNQDVLNFDLSVFIA